MKWAQPTSGAMKTQDMFELGVCCEAAKDCMRISAEDLLRDVQGCAKQQELGWDTDVGASEEELHIALRTEGLSTWQARS